MSNLLGKQPPDGAREIGSHVGDHMRCLNRRRHVVDEKDQHAQAQHRQHDTDRDREVGDELRVVGSAHGPQHQETVDERGDECAERDLVAQIAQKAAQEPGTELLGGQRQGDDGDRERDPRYGDH